LAVALTVTFAAGVAFLVALKRDAGVAVAVAFAVDDRVAFGFGFGCAFAFGFRAVGPFALGKAAGATGTSIVMSLPSDM
jgi:hypothetical protein